MALDEALLEWVRHQPEPVLILRTYRWVVPTLSLGANQKARDIQDLLAADMQGNPIQGLVRRPTGGRAILHGEDISFALITNDPALVKLSLKASYAIFSGLVQAALNQIGVSAQMSESAGTQEYLRSPACFETHTPSDLLGAMGQKIAGSAQLRRAGGILQHGAAFLGPYGVDEPRFFAALCQATTQHYNQPIHCLDDAQLEAMLPDLKAIQQAYCKSSVEILESASTTSLSHLLPASF